MISRLDGLFESLNRHEVKYLVIGGIAAVLHGVPRATFDLDMLIEPSRDNASRLIDAFLEAGLGTAALTNPDEVAGTQITVFKDRIRVDVQTSTPGIEFASAWSRRLVLSFRGRQVPVLSKDDLIKSKRASGRPRDLEDVRILEDDQRS